MSIDVSVEHGIGQVVLRRPHARNAIDADTVKSLGESLQSLGAEDVDAVVITGSEESFCAGADLTLVRRAFETDTAATLGPLVDGLHETIRIARAAPYPLVAAVEGYAVGAGMGLALMADLRVVARSAVFLPGYLPIGASPDGGVSYFLSRALGPARTNAVILRNQPLGAAELEPAGLADQVVDDGQAFDAALTIAAEAAGTPPLALVRLRRLVDASTTHSLDAHLDEERQAVSELWPTADFCEGVHAALERRTPTFSGA